jgi:hypothetical protein
VGSVLPDGLFKNQRSNFGKLWTVLQWKMLVLLWPSLPILPPNGIFNGHLVHFVVIWYIFFPFWYVVPIKIWQPWAHSGRGGRHFTTLPFPAVYEPEAFC